MALLIKNGEIINASGRYHADVYCEGEVIRAIGSNLQVSPDTEIIDAKGKYIFPGFIDPHVHISLPFMGTCAKDNYESASRAALVGGTTTLIEMICPSRGEDLIDAFELWHSEAEGKSACDFSFHMGVPEFNSRVEEQLREIVKRGISSFKVFLAYEDAFAVSDRELYQILSLAKKLGVITAAHCENAQIISELQKRLIYEGKTEPQYHYESRPPIVEAEGVHHFLTFAELLKAHVYIVHLSCKEALIKATEARERGVSCWVETLIQFLTLDKNYAERGNFEGAKFVMSPPLREKSNQNILYSGLREGCVHTVGSDHAPFDFEGQKSMGQEDFTKIPNGIPSLQDRIRILYSYGVGEGKLTLEEFVNGASTQAAKIFGLFPKKGIIKEGSDADIVIYDPHGEEEIQAKDQEMNVDYNPFEGWKVKGQVHLVTVRGKISAHKGKFTGTLGSGKFLQREPNHF